MGSEKDFVIADLRDRPEFFGVVADRIWRAWWQARGYPIEHITECLQDNMSDQPVPFALVAHLGPAFVGTASVITSDLPECPEYSPWVAAVWVEPEYRGRGAGASLVGMAVRTAASFGIDRLYLCASQERRPFYERRGWTLLEENAGERQLAVLTRDTSKRAYSIEELTEADAGAIAQARVPVEFNHLDTLLHPRPDDLVEAVNDRSSDPGRDTGF